MRSTSIKSFQDALAGEMEAGGDLPPTGANGEDVAAEAELGLDPLTGELAEDDPTRPHEYDVAPDGTVRDWREYAPARETERADGEEPATAHPEAEHPDDDANLYPVPTVASFGGRETKEAADLRQIGTELIETTEDFPHLRGKTIDYIWARNGGSSNGEAVVGKTRQLSKYERRHSAGVMMVELAADAVRDLRADRDLVEALVHERLCAIARSKKGKLFIQKPNFYGFTKNVERFRDRLPKVRIAAQVLAREVEDIRNARLPFDDEPASDDHDLSDLPTAEELDVATPARSADAGGQDGD